MSNTDSVKFVSESAKCQKDHVAEHSNSDDHCEVTCSDEDPNNVASCAFKKKQRSSPGDEKKNKSASHKSSKGVPNKSKLQCVSRKSRARNIKKRKWKPYSKLTWEERQKRDERDARRAFKIRERMSSLGITLAPYNTTQFLMEDHNLQEPDYEHIHSEGKHKEYVSDLDSDGYYSSAEDEGDFLQRQFTETYESAHTAYLNDMTKFDIVRELMRLEDEAEDLERALKEAREKKSMCPQTSNLDVEAEMEKIKVYEGEIEKLMKENSDLSKKNEKLHRYLTESA